MKKINAYNPRTKEIESTGFFGSFKQAREYFDNFLIGYYQLVDDASGIYKRAFFK